MKPYELTIIEACKQMKDGELTAVSLTESCLCKNRGRRAGSTRLCYN